MGKLANKVAIVTGAGRGIGQAIAELFAEEGAKVAVLSRTPVNVEAVVASIKNAGGEAIGFPCDIFDLQAIDDTVAAVIKHYGGVDILVNNAHDSQDVRSPLLELTGEHIQRQFNSGPVQALQFMRACHASMVERGGGNIVNIASGSGMRSGNNYGPYSMAKEALRSLTRTAAREWGQFNINVNNVCPVAMTEALELAIKAGWPATPDTPVPRYGDPKEDIAPIVLFLASKDSSYMTGYTLMADGGLMIDTAR